MQSFTLHKSTKSEFLSFWPKLIFLLEQQIKFVLSTSKGLEEICCLDEHVQKPKSPIYRHENSPTNCFTCNLPKNLPLFFITDLFDEEK